MSAPAIISSGTAAGGPPVGGSGILNTIPRWTGATTLGDSVMVQVGSGIGIGMTSGFPGRLGVLSANAIGTADLTFSFDATGTYRHGFSNVFSSGTAANNTSTWLLWNAAGGQTQVMTANGAGNVGIGTAAPLSGAGVGLTVYGATNGPIYLQNSSNHSRIVSNASDVYIDAGSGGTAGAVVFRRSSGLSESARIDLNGNFILNAANASAIIQATGTNQGLKLPATPGNADTQTLDAYQENTWTPTLSAAATWGGTQPTVTSARYTRVGRTITCSVILAATGGAAYSSTWGSTTISAPFASGEYSVVPCAREAPGGSNGIQQTSTVYLPTTASSAAAYWITWTYQV